MLRTLKGEFNLATPKDIKLVSETPDIFKFKINGKAVPFNDEGCFADGAFRKSDISGLIVEGENTVEVFCDFEQSAKTKSSLLLQII